MSEGFFVVEKWEFNAITGVGIATIAHSIIKYTWVSILHPAKVLITGPGSEVSKCHHHRTRLGTEL